MGLFRGRHRFKSSPLSLSVPLDGCDTVLGLQELQRRKDSDVLAKALKLGSYGSASKPSQRQHKGPSLSNLSWSDAQQRPKPWLDFIWGSDWTSYSLCESLTHLGERAEENICHYLPNYLRLFLVFVIAAMLIRPWSFVGAAVFAILALWHPIVEINRKDRALSPKQQRHLTVRQLVWEAMQYRADQMQAAAYHVQAQAATQQRESMQQQQEEVVSNREEVGQSWGYIVCTFAVCFSGIPIVVVRASLYTATVVLVHSSLRQSLSEFEVAVRRVRQKGGVASRGVPFLEVLGLRKSSNADPRRLLKESWSTFASIASAAGTYIWHAAQSKCLNSLRYFWS